MKSVMNHNFGVTPDVKLQRSVFNCSHGYKTTFDANWLIPVYCAEVLPGDSFNVSATFFGRLATPLTPFMDNLRLTNFWFFVPNRLVWSNWQRFYGEQDNPTDSTDYTVPIMDVASAPLSTTGYLEGSLSDYLGLPTKVVGLEHISLYHRAYNKIINDWYRDQNLQDSVVVDVDDGPDDPADYVLFRRNKRMDYFVQALPWPQKPYDSITDVTLPLGTSAEVKLSATTGVPQKIRLAANHNLQTNADDLYAQITSADFYGATGGAAVLLDPNTTLYADLSTATAATINQLRESFQIQRLLEQMARGGSRYIERLRVEFGVLSPDCRLQRAELLSIGSTPINVHPIANTVGVTAANSPTGANKFQGDLSAMGTLSSTNNGFVKSFVEHGMLFCLVCVDSDLTYCQGLDRMFSRQTPFDYYRPVLAHTGEQTILKKELFCDAGGDDDDVFGYVPRYDEYRFCKSYLTGLFRFNATGTLETWHLAQELDDTVELNSDFIEGNTPLDRVVAVPSQPHFLLDCYFRDIRVRPMPTFSIPGLIDHF